MKNILLNGKKLIISENNTQIFLHEDETLNIIHLIEGNDKTFKKRIEFKKRKNDPNQYIFFSYILPTWIAFSGDLILTDTNEITGNISIQFLKERSTSIIEAYYLTINTNTFSITNIITSSIKDQITSTNHLNSQTIEDIESLILKITTKINIMHSNINKRTIPLLINISQILAEEKNILEYIKLLATSYPELQNFLNSYEYYSSRKRTI